MIDKEESHMRRKEIYARIAELRQKVVGSGRGAPAFDSAEVESMALISELQDLGNQELVHEHKLLSKQTAKLKDATTRLTWATWMYASTNYVLFRIYEAALQLRTSTAQKIVVIAVDKRAWQFMRTPLIENWIKWHSPTFYDLEGGPAWKSFLDKKKKNYPNIEHEMPEVINKLNELWIMERQDDFNYVKHVALSLLRWYA